MDMAMKIGRQYSSERVAPGDFEKLAEETGLAKPIVRRRVPELAEMTISTLDKIEMAHPGAEAMAALVHKRCQPALNRFRT
jgi:hypothetical protein